MEVLNYLKHNSIEKLKLEYGIHVSSRFKDLLELNYNPAYTQIKFSDIVQKCNGLLLCKKTFDIVSRPFDRIYNYGELPSHQKECIDVSKCKIIERVDGILIKLYCHNYVWSIELSHDAREQYVYNPNVFFGKDRFAPRKFYRPSFIQLFLMSIQNHPHEDFSETFDVRCKKYLDKNYTYIFKLKADIDTVAYADKYLINSHDHDSAVPDVYFLGARKNDFEGKYLTISNDLTLKNSFDFNSSKFPYSLYNHFLKHVKFPKLYTNFSNIEQCIESLKQPSTTNESCCSGYILFDQESMNPICKIKSPACVPELLLPRTLAENKIDSLNAKDIAEIIVSKRYEEFFLYHPDKLEVEKTLKYHLEIMDEFFKINTHFYNQILKQIKSDDEFDKFIQGLPCSQLMSRTRTLFQQSELQHLQHENLHINLLNVFYYIQNKTWQIQFLSEKVFCPTMILCVGICGSGKSTFAKQCVEFAGFFEINRDDFRFQLISSDDKKKDWSQYHFNRSNEKLVTEKCTEIWERECKVKRVNVIISDCNLKQEYHDFWKKKAEKAGYNFEVKYFPLSLEQAWLIDDLRRSSGSGAVGRRVLIRQHENWIKISNQYRYEPDISLPKAIICDIDGTVALPNGRNIYDNSENILNDTPRKEIIAMMKAWALAENLKIVFVSGRNISCKENTKEWLKRNFYEPKINHIFMRREDDFRRDCIVKKELFMHEIANRYNVIAVVDDRPQTVRMWHDIGIENVINVQKGYNEF